VDKHNIEFSKVNVGGEEIAGAQIQIKSGDTVVASWTSEAGKNKTIELTEGTYTFHEVSAPDGYEAVTDITFTVTSNGTVTVDNASGNTVKTDGSKLIVTDQTSETPKHNIEFSKVNVGGEEIAGAQIQIKSGDTVVASWTSEAGKNKTIELTEGTYTFHEVSAPDGYEAVTDITFTVTSNGTVTVDNASGNTVKTDGSKLIVTDQTSETPRKPVPQTGDMTNGAAIAVVATLGLALVCGAFYARKNRKMN
jgi:LPXTG-motif cell wall-anchored protein